MASRKCWPRPSAAQSTPTSSASGPREAITGMLDGTRRQQRRPGRGVRAAAGGVLPLWNQAMPFLFERGGDYTELLIPAHLLPDDSVLDRAVEVLTEDVCEDVEVIGWLYQFYIAERKDEVFAGFKKNKKAGADEIPAATQLFTPHWIVRYLVENSLGRLWMLNRPTPPGRADGVLHRPGRRGNRLPQDLHAGGDQGHRPGVRVRAHAHLRVRPALRHLRRRGLQPPRTSPP